MKIFNKLIDYICSLFSSKEAQYDLSEYKTHLDLGKDEKLEIVELVEVPNNGKINLVIMDDNVAAGEITKKEIIKLSKIAKSINDAGLGNLSKNTKDFIQKLTNKQLIKLTRFDINNYNIIMCTGKMAAFQVMNLLDEGVKIDKAFLDIILGGYNIYHGKGVILDGIDVAESLLKANPETDIVFYSGCSLDDDSVEFNKGNKLLNKDIRKMVIGKDNDAFGKRNRLIEFLL